eukprot:Opistho-2@29873
MKKKSGSALPPKGKSRSLEDINVLREAAAIAAANKDSVGSQWLPVGFQPDRYKAYTDSLRTEVTVVQNVIDELTDKEKKWPFSRRKTAQDAVLWGRTGPSVSMDTVFGRHSIAANEQHAYLGKIALLQFAIDRIIHSAERLVYRAAKATRHKKSLGEMAAYAKAADGTYRMQPIAILGGLVTDMIKSAADSNAMMSQLEARALEAEGLAAQAHETVRILQEVLTKREEGKLGTNVSITIPPVAVGVSNLHTEGELDVNEPGRDVATQTQDMGQFCPMCFDIGKKIALIQRIAADMLTGNSKATDVRRPSLTDIRRTVDGEERPQSGTGFRTTDSDGDDRPTSGTGRRSSVKPDSDDRPTSGTGRRSSLKPDTNADERPPSAAGGRRASVKPVDTATPDDRQSVAVLEKSPNAARTVSIRPVSTDVDSSSAPGAVDDKKPDAGGRRVSIKPPPIPNALAVPGTMTADTVTSDSPTPPSRPVSRARSGSARHDPVPSVDDGVSWLALHARELEHVRDYIKARERDIEGLRADLAQSRDKGKRLELRVARLESDLQRAIEARDTVARSHAEETARLRQNNAEDLVLAEKRRQVAIAQERKCTDNAVAQLAAFKDLADSAVAKERAQIATLTAELKQLHSMIEHEGSRVVVLQDAVRERDALRIQMRTRDAELEEARAKVHSYTSRIAAIDATEAAWRTREQELMTSISNTTAELQKTQLARTTAALDTDFCRKEAASSRQEMERMRARMDEEVRRSVSTEESRRNLEDQVAYLEETIERLRIQISAAGSAFPLVEEFDRVALERNLTSPAVSTVQRLVDTNTARIGQLEEKNERLQRMILDDAEGKSHRTMPKSTTPTPLWNASSLGALFGMSQPPMAWTPQPDETPRTSPLPREVGRRGNSAGADSPSTPGRKQRWEGASSVRTNNSATDVEKTTYTAIGRRTSYIPKLVSLTGHEDLGGHVTRVDSRTSPVLPSSGRVTSPGNRRNAPRLPAESG